MKTFRTILATLGVTTLAYGIFALLTVRIDPAFAGRSIFQMFRDTGVPALILGIACLLSVTIIAIAVTAFRDEPHGRRTAAEDDDLFLENETVPVDTYEEEWSPELKKKGRAALSLEEDEEPETPDLFADDDEPEPEARLDETLFAKPKVESMRRCVFCGTSFPHSESVCPKCGKRA